MADQHDTSGAAKDEAAEATEQRRVVQPLNVIRGNRARPSGSELPAVQPNPQLEGPVRPGSSGVPQSTLLYLWTHLSQQPWSSLVVVPSHPGGSGQLVARAIVEVGTAHRSAPIHLLDAQGLELGAASTVVKEMRAYTQQGDRVVVLIDSVVVNPVGLEVALAAERALLCVALSQADFTSARRTLELIGKERFIGSVTLPPPGASRT